MQTWGLTFDDDVTVCDGRELEAESISQGGKTFQYDLKGGQNRRRGRRSAEGGCYSWVWVYRTLGSIVPKPLNDASSWMHID